MLHLYRLRLLSALNRYGRLNDHPGLQRSITSQWQSTRSTLSKLSCPSIYHVKNHRPSRQINRLSCSKVVCTLSVAKDRAYPRAEQIVDSNADLRQRRPYGWILLGDCKHSQKRNILWDFFVILVDNQTVWCYACDVTVTPWR